MMFNCEYCEEEACVELTEGKEATWSIRGEMDYNTCFLSVVCKSHVMVMIYGDASFR